MNVVLLKVKKRYRSSTVSIHKTLKINIKICMLIDDIFTLIIRP